MKIFASKQNKQHLDDFIIAIGGGATIDEAKIYAKKNKKYCIAIPTTGAGATETTHAVVWGKTKKNVKTDKPLTVVPPFKIKLSKKARINTCYDIIGHLVDYLNVCSDNELVEVGIMMGKLIEQRPTNLTHPASYPLTLKGMPHGEAVGRVLKESLDKAFPL
jgi:alcohol dehydrogenase YqhD (iron-dependent ADH family)